MIDHHGRQSLHTIIPSHFVFVSVMLLYHPLTCEKVLLHQVFVELASLRQRVKDVVSKRILLKKFIVALRRRIEFLLMKMIKDSIFGENKIDCCDTYFNH